LVDTWTHVAVCRSGSSLKGYVDGAEVFSETISGSVATQSSYTLKIGTGNGSSLTGYMDNVRIINGTAAYTAPFTPPDAAFTVGPTDGQVLTWVDANSRWEPAAPSSGGGATAINDLTDVDTDGTTGDANFDNVSLLTHGDAFSDSSSNSLTVTNANNVVLETTISKFGGGSYDFRAEKALVRVGYDPVLDLSSGDWTVEFWVFTPSNPTEMLYPVCFGESNTSVERSWELRMNDEQMGMSYTADGSTTNISSYSGSGSYTWSSNAWQHFAWVRNGDTLRFYKDGNAVGTPVTLSTGFVTGQMSQDIGIGARRTNDILSGIQPAGVVPGYMEDIRVTKGVARYTGATYTVPTEAFPNAGGQGPASDGQVLIYNSGSSVWLPGDVVDKATLQAEVAASTDFADFQSRIAAL